MPINANGRGLLAPACSASRWIRRSKRGKARRWYGGLQAW